MSEPIRPIRPIGYIALAVSIFALWISTSNYLRINRDIGQWCVEHGSSNPAAEAYCKKHAP